MWKRLCTALALGLIGATGCGGGDDAPSAASGDQVHPIGAWVSSACSAEATWFRSGEKGATDLLAQLEVATTADEWKRILTSVSTSGVKDTRQLEADLWRAGVPDVDRGQEI